MEILILCVLSYVAIGAVFFAHPTSRSLPDDFDWPGQIGVFRTALPEVFGWPVTLWRFGRTRLGRD